MRLYNVLFAAHSRPNNIIRVILQSRHHSRQQSDKCVSLSSLLCHSAVRKLLSLYDLYYICATYISGFDHNVNLFILDFC